MKAFLVFLSDTNVVSIVVRLLLAAVFGGALGFGREKRGQAAGFRTYMIVCVGSALVMLTNIFLADRYGVTDIARLPAAVITGLGFLGAGAIIVTHNQNVRGLTTAAGLWTTAAMGIAFGAGFYIGGFACFILTITILLFMERVSHRIGLRADYVSFFIVMKNRSTIGRIFSYAAENGISIADYDIENDGDPEFPSKSSGKFSFDVSSVHNASLVQHDLESIDGIINVYKI